MKGVFAEVFVETNFSWGSCGLFPIKKKYTNQWNIPMSYIPTKG